MNLSHQAIRYNKRPLGIILPGLFLLTGILFSVVASASISTVGSEIHALQAKTRALQKQNDQYQVELAKVNSLDSARASALQMGFVPIESILVLDQTNTAIALKQ